MSTQDDLIYDDVESMKFIKNYLPQELKEKFSDDDIYYIVDLIYDFYDSKDFMDESDDDDSVVEINEEELIDYVIKNAQKDGVGKFLPEEIQFVIQGELEYCDSLNMFD